MKKFNVLISALLIVAALFALSSCGNFGKKPYEISPTFEGDSYSVTYTFNDGYGVAHTHIYGHDADGNAYYSNGIREQVYVFLNDGGRGPNVYDVYEREYSSSDKNDWVKVASNTTDPSDIAINPVNLYRAGYNFNYNDSEFTETKAPDSLKNLASDLGIECVFYSVATKNGETYLLALEKTRGFAVYMDKLTPEPEYDVNIGKEETIDNEYWSRVCAFTDFFTCVEFTPSHEIKYADMLK